ncbi:MAG: UDP-2,3-diacylglucosamine diphosphatase [Weeksellaceae bacterium]|nr:UDP-2,3-diacylglucosamine diphosphatase [Weeksellaceae bacterium]
MKRKIPLVVISDVHLGTYGSRASELLQYLNSIDPETLVLNGDIIDMWQFKKNFFPQNHMKVLKKILDLSSNGTEVIYITGNHDEYLRRFTPFDMGNFALVDKVVLNLNGKQAWIFHGDVFDSSIQNAKWLAKLGGVGYDILIRINNVINWILVKMGREKFSLAKKIKNSVKKAVKYINDFEQTASELAIDNNYDYVICGHIHMPQMREVVNENGSTLYLNSGDWIENLSALEYDEGQWKIILYSELRDTFVEVPEEEIASLNSLEIGEVFKQMNLKNPS